MQIFFASADLLGNICTLLLAQCSHCLEIVPTFQKGRRWLPAQIIAASSSTIGVAHKDSGPCPYIRKNCCNVAYQAFMGWKNVMWWVILLDTYAEYFMTERCQWLFANLFDFKFLNFFVRVCPRNCWSRTYTCNSITIKIRRFLMTVPIFFLAGPKLESKSESCSVQQMWWCNLNFIQSLNRSLKEYQVLHISAKYASKTLLKGAKSRKAEVQISLLCNTSSLTWKQLLVHLLVHLLNF